MSWFKTQKLRMDFSECLKYLLIDLLINLRNYFGCNYETKRFIFWPNIYNCGSSIISLITSEKRVLLVTYSYSVMIFVTVNLYKNTYYLKFKYAGWCIGKCHFKFFSWSSYLRSQLFSWEIENTKMELHNRNVSWTNTDWSKI